MRNSFSLPVYFSIVYSSDVNLFCVRKYQAVSASKMKLIWFQSLLINFAGLICAQKFQQDQFPFPPQFQTPSSAFTSDSSIYLPPESHTPIPYFSINNLNKLPFQFLPPTGTKAPSMFPSPSPIYMSSTLRFDDEDDDDENDHGVNNHTPDTNRITQNNMFNRANNNTMKQALDKKDAMAISRISHHQPPAYQQRQMTQPIQPRFDVKPPSYVTIGPQTKNQNPAARRMILTSEIQRAEPTSDQTKASASYQSPQYVQAPGVFISSTTEPAIPILRLSNEMDLDGSFSYEALGADQTHYVQHSRMENMGSDKEEQVVEGSYSYIGDDGRTYTVHYVADSNGFRATGDHLPVPPPVPEIIQRAIQYNLAEEAKRPPHLKASWENVLDDKEYENINDRGFYNNQPPPRNLFTGKTPEAFSFGFAQGTNAQNNLVPAASYQVPSKTNNENSMEQSKPKANPMPTPQITFLASQGAHNPSAQPQPSKPAISERSSLPQLMNYEAEIKDIDQEASKALWRWQYGLNANTNQNPKNSISRSSAEDDVVINFGDMTPDQYTHMIHTEILSQNSETSNNVDYNADDKYQSSYQSQNIENKTYTPEYLQVSTEVIDTQPIQEITTKQNINYDFRSQIFKHEDDISTGKIKNSEIISRQNFIPKSQYATQSYDFDEASFEPSKITIPNGNPAINLKTVQKVSEDELSLNHNSPTTTLEPLSITPKTNLNFLMNEENSSFRPILVYNSEQEIKDDSMTTEVPLSEKLRENMFLRNLFKPSNNEEKATPKLSLENNKQVNSNNIEKQPIKEDKEFQYYHQQETPTNEVKVMKSKPIDINNILNYVVLKNHFESAKTKQKNKPLEHFIPKTHLKDIPTHYVPVKENTSYYVEPNDADIQKQENDFRTINHQQQNELQGIIKNYKVLQRKKNNMQRSQVLPEPQRHIKAFHTQSLPPLGRAGPSMKSYLPPTYL